MAPRGWHGRVPLPPSQQQPGAASRDRCACLITTLLLLADYINFMKQVTPETTQEYMNQLKRFNMGAPGESDCPVFDGMYEYFAVSAEQQGRSGASCCGGRTSSCSLFTHPRCLPLSSVVHTWWWLAGDAGVCVCVCVCPFMGPIARRVSSTLHASTCDTATPPPLCSPAVLLLCCVLITAAEWRLSGWISIPGSRQSRPGLQLGR
jgi:hypothetical protein